MSSIPHFLYYMFTWHQYMTANTGSNYNIPKEMFTVCKRANVVSIGYKTGTVCFPLETSRLSLHRSEWGSWVEIPTLLSSQVKMCESDWFHTGVSATGTIFPTFFTKKMILKKWKLWEIEQVKDISALAMMCKIWKMMCKIWKKHPKCKLQYRENCGRYRNDLLDQ